MPRSVTNTKTTAKKSGPFQRGYAAAKESAASSNSYGDTLFWFKVQGDKHRAVEEEVVFLHEYPTVVRMHNLTREINGKTVPQSILCTQDKSCVACDMGARVSSQSVFLILVPSTRDDSEFVVRRYMVSSKAIPQLERLSEKKGIAQKFTNIVRTGNDTSTTYSFELGDEVETPYSVEDVAELLPESLAEILLEIWEDNDRPEVDDAEAIEDVYESFLQRILQMDLDVFNDNSDDYSLSSFEARGKKEESPARERRSGGRSTRRSTIVVQDDDDEDLPF